MKVAPSTNKDELRSPRIRNALKSMNEANKLEKIGPFIACFAIAFQAVWCFFWYFNSGSTTCVVSGLENVGGNVCIPGKYRSFDDENFRLFSLFTSGTFLASLCLQICDLTELEDNFKKAPIYCCATINGISFVSHISMACGYFPIIISSWGRLTHVARWGEWIATVPLLMVMMHSLDIRNTEDMSFMWLSTTLQTVSVLCGGVASIVQDFNLALVLMFFSFLLYFHIFYVAWKSVQRYKQHLDKEQKKSKKKEPLISSMTSGRNSFLMSATNLEDVVGVTNTFVTSC